MILTGIITIGDCPSDGAFANTAGPALRDAVSSSGWQTIAEALVSGNPGQIAQTIRSFAQQGCQLILTSGGTGLSLHDTTPDAVREVARLEVPIFGEMMRSQPAAEYPGLRLSRGLGAVVGNSLLVALPGAPADALAGFALLTGLIPPAVARLQEGAVPAPTA